MEFKIYNIEIQKGTSDFTDLIENEKLISLEFSPDVILEKFRSLIILKEHILIQHGHDKVSVFNYKGKFLYNIGERGKGPGEFRAITDMGINSVTRNIEILEYDGSFHKFSLDGNWINTSRIKFPTGLNALHKFERMDDQTLVIFSWATEDFLFHIYNEKKSEYVGKKVFISSEIFRRMAFMPRKIGFRVEGKLHIHDFYNDVVYKIEDGKWEEVVKFLFNGNTLPLEEYTRKSNKNENIVEFSKNYSIFYPKTGFSNDYHIISGLSNGKNKYLIKDSTSNSNSYTELNDKSKNKFIFLPFWSFLELPTSFSQKYCGVIVDAKSFCEKYSISSMSKSNQEILKNSEPENSNPILILYDLK